MYKIAVLPGDGIGPEVTREGLKVLKKPRRLPVLNMKPKSMILAASVILIQVIFYRNRH